jgi:hypothetical protein
MDLRKVTYIKFLSTSPPRNVYTHRSDRAYQVAGLWLFRGIALQILFRCVVYGHNYTATSQWPLDYFWFSATLQHSCKCFARTEFTGDEIQTRADDISTCYINVVVRQHGNYVTFWSLQQYIWKHGVRSCQYQTSIYITDSQEKYLCN